MERRGYQGRKGMCVMRTDWDVTMRCDAMRCVVMRCAVGIGGKAISPAQSNELSCEWECTRQYGQSGRGVERSHAVSNTPAPASSPASLLLRSCSCSLAPFQLLPLPPVSRLHRPLEAVGPSRSLGSLGPRRRNHLNISSMTTVRPISRFTPFAEASLIIH
jgi:hypothetical protein